MRILHISSARNFGGGERHIVDLSRGLVNKGHEVFVALRPTNEWQHRLDFLPPENIFHVSIRNSFGVLSAIRIAEFARDNRIDIIHAHVARDYIPASIACLAAKETRFVLTRHVLFPLKPFNRFALKNLSKAIGVSDAVGENLRAVFPASKVAVVYNGIESRSSAASGDGLRDEFRRLHSISDDEFLIGTLGELKELKGQRHFVLAANEIIQRGHKCRFVIVGKDNSAGAAFRSELRRLVRVFGMEDRFLWLDWLDDPASFFAASDIFVSPSLSESFGLAILEAMYAGRAVVSTDTDGAKQLLGPEGRLARQGDAVGLADRICELLEDREAAAGEGLRLRAIAADRFSLQRMVDETDAIYNSVMR